MEAGTPRGSVTLDLPLRAPHQKVSRRYCPMVDRPGPFQLPWDSVFRLLTYVLVHAARTGESKVTALQVQPDRSTRVRVPYRWQARLPCRPPV